MQLIEILLLSVAAVLTVHVSFSYRHLSQLVKQIQAQSKETNRLNGQARKRLAEAIAYQQEALHVRDKARKEAERITAYWNTERLN